MKKFLFHFCWFFFIKISTLLSQEVTAEMDPSIHAQMKASFAGLNPSLIRTGFLADLSQQFVPFASVSQSQLDSANAMTIDRYGMLYGSVLQSVIGSWTSSINPKQEFTEIMRHITEDSPIPIGLICVRYDAIRDEAFSNGYIVNSGDLITQTVQDPDMLYRQDTLMGAISYMDVIRVPNPRFFWSSRSLISNMGASIDSLMVDFEDGMGVRKVLPDQPIEILYASGGMRHIVATIHTSDGNILRSHFYIEIVLQDASALLTDPYPHTSHTIDGVGEGSNPIHLKIMSACEVPGRITKPFIIVDGFEPNIEGNTNEWNDLFLNNRLRVESNQQSGTEFYETILAEGYDIIFADYGDVMGRVDHYYGLIKTTTDGITIKGGQNDIFINAATFQAALEWINEQKNQNGSYEKNVVVGMSMGGLVSKIALRKMELAGKDHQTKTFFSYDSPMQGAHILLALQGTLLHFGGTIFAGTITLEDLISKIANPLKTLRSKAAKQMTYYSLPSYENTGYLKKTINVIPNLDHDDFFARVEALGELQHCVYKAVSNGNQSGLGQSFEPGSLLGKLGLTNHHLFDLWRQGANDFWDISTYVLEYISYFVFNIFGLAELHATPNGGSGEIYSGTIIQTLGPVILPGLTWLSSVKYKVNNLKPYDSAPGGFTSLGTDALPGLYMEHNVGCHAPTVSGLSIKPPYNQNPYIDLSSLNPRAISYAKNFFASKQPSHSFGYKKKIKNGNEATYEWVDYGTNSNQAHVFMDRQRAHFLLWDMKSLDNLRTTSQISNRVYNFGLSDSDTPAVLAEGQYKPEGTGYTITNNLTFTDKAKLLINNGGRLGYADDPLNPINRDNCHFGVSIEKNHCDGTPVLVSMEEGTELVIGDLGVNNKGTLSVQNECTLKINKDAQLRIINGSKLMINKGGTLEISGINNLKLEDRSIVEVYGTIILSSEVNWTQLDGIFDLKDGCNIIVSGKWTMSGVSKVKTLIKMDKNVQINVVQQDIDWSQFKIEQDQNNLIKISRSKVLIDRLLVIAPKNNNPYYNNQFLEVTNPVSVLLKDSRIEYLTRGIVVDQIGEAECMISNCQFWKNNTFGIHLKNGKKARVENTILRGIYYRRYRSELTVPSPYTEHGSLAGMIIEKIDNHQNYHVEVDSFLAPSSAGIRLKHTKHFIMEGGSVSTCRIGIDAGKLQNATNDGGENNMSIINCATIQKNEIGIRIDGGIASLSQRGLNYGRVTMRRANLLDNTLWGIQGTDVLLDIQGSRWTYNTFSSYRNYEAVAGRLFFVEYDQYQNINSIPAQYNRWLNSNAYTDNPIRRVNSTTLIPVVYYPTLPYNVPEAPCEMFIFKVGPDGKYLPLDNEMLFGGNGINCVVDKGKYELGVMTDIKGDKVTSYDQLTKVISEASVNNDVACDLDYLLALAAGTFVPSDGKVSEELVKRSTEDSTLALGDYSILPNPSSGLVYLKAPPIQTYTVRITDMLGRSKVLKAVGNQMIDIQDLPSGSYQMRLEGLNGKILLNQKVMIIR
ncbi:MAG: T9SS type A sorting domain-containing protein [Saprospiraceae bacterium]|nr:T9SS type A sorting domain-containing protein [Saprospiraceae bacterium]